MCGIAGCWHLDGRPIDPGALERFTDTLTHRGPDGRGTWIDADAALGLGHRRLAILDLSEEARQPMAYAEGRYWLVFNGEIYNFLELRAELEGKGHRFRTQGDAEVILAAWVEWGPAAFLRFNGMWAFALWDRVERRLVLSRDRFGIKPLLYVHEPGRRFAFASEQRAFAVLEGFVPALDPEASRVVLLDPFALEGGTRGLWTGVRRVPGGHWLEIGAGGVAQHRWWNTLDHLPDVPSSLEAQAARFAELFDDAIRLRMRSDVPIGTCLSGGFDSSAVVSRLGAIGGGADHGGARHAPEWQHSFVATFPGASNDERPYAEEVIRWAGVHGVFLPMTSADAIPDLEPTLRALEDVYQSPSTAAWRIYRELRRNGVVVSLDGHGADELMGAYLGDGELLMREAPHWWSAPGANIRLLRHHFEGMDPSVRPAGAAAALAALRLTLGHHPDLGGVRPVLRRWRARFAPAGLGGRGALVRGRRPDFAAFAAPASADRLPEAWGPVDRALYRMFHVDLLPTILRNFDRLSTAHGVEVRMPFMDWRLVTFVMALPEASKVGGGVTKRVAREALRGRMPESVRTSRRKVGFNSPLPEWLAGPLHGWTDALLAAAPGDHPVVDVPGIRRLVAAARRAGWTAQNAVQVWPLLHYLWLERTLRASPVSFSSVPR